MFLFGTSVDKLKKEIQEKETTIRELRFELECATRKAALNKEEALNTIRKEMEKRLIESDLERVKADSSLKAYKEIDLKDLRNKLESMMENLVKALGAQKEVTVIK